ncbi:hypothetical protein TI05_00615 [Achromatium sp. WMS3]|nr:hypothetical protein TI05_00615 [Achromatium sp. WMS3]
MNGDDAELPPEFSVTDEELSNKSGNYIFTIGNAGCGKTTLQQLLVARLWDRNDIKLDSKNQNNDHRQDTILNNWVMSIKQGEFSERSKVGTIQEFNIAFSQNGQKPLDLNFLEISGEDIKSIIPTLNAQVRPQLHSQLQQYLQSSSINKRYILVSDGQKHMRSATPDTFTEDMLFNALLQYLLKNSERKLQILFVVAQWDKAQQEYPHIKVYLAKNFPQTWSILNSKRCDASFIPFTVGTTAQREEIGPDGEIKKKDYITSLESRYVDLLIQWIYDSFTGHQLHNMHRIRLTLFDKIIKFIFSQ